MHIRGKTLVPAGAQLPQTAFSWALGFLLTVTAKSSSCNFQASRAAGSEMLHGRAVLSLGLANRQQMTRK